MKTSLLLPALAFGLTAAFTPAHAQDTEPVTLTPEMQAMLAQLLKGMAEAKPELVPVPDAVPQSTAPVAPAPASAPQPAAPAPSSLRTGSLTTGTLAPSAPLGGRGAIGGLARLSDQDWRALFPIKQERK